MASKLKRRNAADIVGASISRRKVQHTWRVIANQGDHAEWAARGEYAVIDITKLK